jgi:hypothetical protein
MGWVRLRREKRGACACRAASRSAARSASGGRARLLTIASASSCWRIVGPDVMPSTCEPPPPTPLPEGDEARCESIAAGGRTGTVGRLLAVACRGCSLQICLDVAMERLRDE